MGEAVTPADGPIIEVVLTRPTVWPGIRQSDELAGLFTANIEYGLADLHGVVPWVDGVGVSPGFDERLRNGSTRWTAKLGLVAKGENIAYGLLLCNSADECNNFEVVGPQAKPAEASAALLKLAAEALGRLPDPEAMALWALPQSKDPYAELICGRGAAVFYGIRPALDPLDVGDQRKDPIERAVYIDPSMPLGWWIAGRAQAQRDEWGRARESFTRASIARPSSVLFLADEAYAFSHNLRWDAAWSAWASADSRSPGDIRFVAPRARAALRSERVKQAIAILDALPTPFQNERRIAELRVQIAETTGASSNYDELLEHWQDAAPNDPEPVRRRIALRVDDGRYAEALVLCDELEARGAVNEAGRLAMSLSIGLGKLPEAAGRADELGLTEVAARIRARAKLEDDPGAMTPELAVATDPVGLVVAGEALLADGQPSEGLVKVQAALKLDPWNADALAVQIRIYEALDQPLQASEARHRLRLIDPEAPLLQAL